MLRQEYGLRSRHRMSKRLYLLSAVLLISCSELPVTPRLQPFVGSPANAYSVQGTTRAQLLGRHTDGVYASTVIEPRDGANTRFVSISSFTTWIWRYPGGEFEDSGHCQFWNHPSFVQASCLYTPPYLYGGTCQGEHRLNAETSHVYFTPEGGSDFITRDADVCTGPYPAGGSGGPGDEEYCWTEYMEAWDYSEYSGWTLIWSGSVTICSDDPT